MSEVRRTLICAAWSQLTPLLIKFICKMRPETAVVMM